VWTQNVYDSWSMKGDHDGCDHVTVLGKLPKIKGNLFGIRSTLLFSFPELQLTFPELQLKLSSLEIF